MPLACPREIPSQETIRAVSELDVLNENGRAVTFGSLFERQKTIAVFIRTCRPTTNSLVSCLLYALPTGHFWCAVSGFFYIMLFDHSYWRLIDMPGNLGLEQYFGFS
jgi:hypothetical protein